MKTPPSPEKNLRLSLERISRSGPLYINTNIIDLYDLAPIYIDYRYELPSYIYIYSLATGHLPAATLRDQE